MNNDKIMRKIKALMSQANDQAGTPEGDAFLDKALTLMAEYGVEQAQLNEPADNEIISRDISFSGSYTDMQHTLLGQIAKALHCTTIGFTVPRSSRITHATLFGRKRHVERVEMLFTVLNPEMVVSAKRVTGNYWSSTVTSKRSYMTGFAVTIGARLHELENERAGNYNTATMTGAVALMDDLSLAEDALATAHPDRVTRDHSKRRYDAHSYAGGQEKGRNTDIGQTRVENRRALTS